MSSVVSKRQEATPAEAVASPPSFLFVDRLLRVREVRGLAGIGRNTIYTWMGEGKFPLPVDLGGSRVAWRLSDINAWIASRPSVTSVRVKRGVKPWERTQHERKAS